MGNETNAIDELGYTTRALFLMNEKHNQIGALVGFGQIPLKVLREWVSNVYEPVRKAMVARNLEAKRLAREGVFTGGGKESDYDGEELTMPDKLKTASRGEQYAYILKLADINKVNTFLDGTRAIKYEEDKAFKACENDSTFDQEIMGSDAYKTL